MTRRGAKTLPRNGRTGNRNSIWIADKDLGRGAGRRSAFLHENHFDRFDSPALTGRTSGSTIAGPIEPSYTRDMSTVPNVIFIGSLAGQANLDGLKALRLSSRTAEPFRPLLPANIRDMATKLNRTRVTIPVKLGFKSLHGKAPTSCPRNRSASHGRHPANIRCMRANGNRSGDHRYGS